MRIECDEWDLDSAELEWLTPHSDGRFATLRAIVAIGYEDEIEPWLIGQAAWLAWGEKRGSGFSPGATADETKRRANWASGASKALHKWNIDKLKDYLNQYREDGGKPQSVSWNKMLERCDHHILHGSAASCLRAIDTKVRLIGKSDSVITTEPVKQLVAKVGPERTQRGLEELGLGSLLYMVPDLFEQNTEDGNAKSRSDARCAGDDPGNFNGGGVRRAVDDTAREMDRRPGNAGGAAASQRPDGSPEIIQRIGQLEATA